MSYMCVYVLQPVMCVYVCLSVCLSKSCGKSCGCFVHVLWCFRLCRPNARLLPSFQCVCLCASLNITPFRPVSLPDQGHEDHPVNLVYLSFCLFSRNTAFSWWMEWMEWLEWMECVSGRVGLWVYVYSLSGCCNECFPICVSKLCFLKLVVQANILNVLCCLKCCLMWCKMWLSMSMSLLMSCGVKVVFKTKCKGCNHNVCVL